MRWLAVAALLFGACKNPSYVSGHLRCAARAPQCPDEFHCAADDRCWKNGEEPGARDLSVIGDPPMDLAGELDLAGSDLASAADLAGADLAAVPCAGGDGTPCTDGLCHNGGCDKTSCFILGAWYSDGTADPNNPCMGCNLALSRVSWTAFANGTQCSDGIDPGKCYAGACCTGCWTGISCVTGTNSLACGNEGAMCRDCRDLAGGNFGTCFSDSTCQNNAPNHFYRPVSCQAGGCYIGLGSTCCSNGCNVNGCI